VNSNASIDARIHGTSNGQNGAECCLACVYAIFVVISEVVKKACIGAGVHRSIHLNYGRFTNIG
jgi:hypothetical protein